MLTFINLFWLIDDAESVKYDLGVLKNWDFIRSILNNSTVKNFLSKI